EALQCVNQAKRMQAMFQPQDDLPDACEADLKRGCANQLKVYTDAARTLMVSGQFAQAEQYLGYTQNLALTFRMDEAPIRAMMAGAQAKAQAPPLVAPPANPPAAAAAPSAPNTNPNDMPSPAASPVATAVQNPGQQIADQVRKALDAGDLETA